MSTVPRILVAFGSITTNPAVARLKIVDTAGNYVTSTGSGSECECCDAVENSTPCPDGVCYSEWRATPNLAAGCPASWTIRRVGPHEGPVMGWTSNGQCSYKTVVLDGCRWAGGVCPTVVPPPPSAEVPEGCCPGICPCVEISSIILAGFRTLAGCHTFEVPGANPGDPCCTAWSRYSAAVNVDGANLSGLFSEEWANLQFSQVNWCPGDVGTPCDPCTSDECGWFNATNDFQISAEVRCGEGYLAGTTEARVTIRTRTQLLQCSQPAAFAWDSGWVQIDCNAPYVTLSDEHGVGAAGWSFGFVTLELTPAGGGE